MKKTIIFIALIFISLLNINAQAWNQIGVDITGEVASKLGHSVSSSSDGLTIAVSSHFYGTKLGYVQVFNNINGNWVQKGANIKGEFKSDFFGKSICLNTTGNIIAIGGPENNGGVSHGDKRGHVQVYEFINGDWKQIGDDIDGANDGDLLGYSVSMDITGTIVAIGSIGYNNNMGKVQIFKLTNGSWVIIDDKIKGINKNDEFGHSVSLNADGSIIAVGAPYNKVLNENFKGYVKVYKNVANHWKEVGDLISGEANADSFGTSVSINLNGTIVVIGAPDNDENGNKAGHASIFKNTNDIWQKIGGNIIGDSKNDHFGISVSINDSGNIIAVGADSPFDNESGYAKVLKFNQQEWKQIGDNIKSGLPFNYYGRAVCLNADGLNVVIGGDGQNGLPNSTGLVKVYENLLPIVAQHPLDQIDVCANDEIQFAIAGSMIDNYRWEVKLKNSNVWSVLFNDDNIHGVNTNQLSLLAEKYLNKALFRCRVNNDYGEVVSNSAQLLLENEKPTISCIGQQFVKTNNGNTYIVQGNEFDPIMTNDNCEVKYFYNNKNWQASLEGYNLSIGTHHIIWYIVDYAGNYNYCISTIYVSKQSIYSNYLKSKNKKEINVSIYPNPTNKYLSLNVRNKKIQKLTINDLSGKIVLNEKNPNNNNTIDVSILKAGIYVVNIEIDGEILSTKFIKE
jgi:hypothetical protein